MMQPISMGISIPGQIRDKAAVPSGREKIKESGNEPLQSDEVSISSDTGTKKGLQETRTRAEAEKPNPDQYHFKPSHRVEQTAKGWVMHLPNAKIPMPRKPEWLSMLDRMNKILDQSSDPVAVRKTVDDIKDISNKNYNATSLQFKADDLNAYINNIDNLEVLQQTKKIFSELLANETQSTHQVGGVMAGSRCSEMHKYGRIMDTLDKKLSDSA